MWKHGVDMKKTALPGAKAICKIRLEYYLMSGILVVSVITWQLYVVSNDKRVCECVRFRFVCCFEEATILINFISQTAALLSYCECRCYTGCFMTCEHYWMRWFPRSLWSENSHKHVADFGRLRSYNRWKLRIEGNDYWQ